ncbi:bifunctional protein FolD [Mycobacterium xenopi 3993]|nr:bifunctional protein FolD [Mycobacterium xenopi 3993]
MQLPLPKHLDENAALERVDPAKDVDGLHPTNLGRLVLGTPARCRAPRAASCTCCGATTCRSRVPTRSSSAGCDGRPPVGSAAHPPHRKRHSYLVPHGNSRPSCADPAGRYHRRRRRCAPPGDRGHGPPGAAVIDVGVSRTEDGLIGDVHPDVWEVAGHVSPNPGGVGPLTRAFLLTNVVELAEAARDRA